MKNSIDFYKCYISLDSTQSGPLPRLKMIITHFLYTTAIHLEDKLNLVFYFPERLLRHFYVVMYSLKGNRETALPSIKRLPIVWCYNDYIRRSGTISHGQTHKPVSV